MGYRSWKARCICGAGQQQGTWKPDVALSMQLSTIRELPRRRARSTTIYPCAKCVKKIHTKEGRKLRRRLAEELLRQFLELRGTAKEKKCLRLNRAS